MAAKAIDLMRGFLTDDGQYSATLPDQQIARTMMHDRRQQDSFNRLDASLSSPYAQVATNLGPLPDAQWDGFFGAQAMRENAANMKGGRLAVDYMGRGPGTHTGFGSWKANVDGGTSVNLADESAGADLASATATAEASRERQQGLAVQPREQDYGIFSPRPQAPQRRIAPARRPSAGGVAPRY